MKPRLLLVLVVACLFAIVAVNVALADDSETKAQLDQMQKQIDSLKAQLTKQQAAAPKGQQAEAAKEKPVGFSFKDPLSFRVLGTEVSFYGLADVSVDYVDNGLKNQAGAIGNNGWLPQVSSNLSYFGVRGSRPLFGDELSAIFQLETEAAYSYTPGGPNPQTGDTAINNGLGARNSYVGFIGSWGALKVGKTDAPYKTSTARMDPFDRTLGDYNAIMGNTGGDNRAEFDTRLAHAIWYESPQFSGFNFNVLWAPGQNRGTDNIIAARLEPNCTGGNPEPCNDGSFGHAFSTALTYTGGPLYLVAAYELHKDVNRLGDEGGASGNVVTGVHDEWAFKVGAQYYLAETGSTFNAIYEKMKRVGAPDAYNERSRDLSLWFALTQDIGKTEALNLAWAHAGKSPGSPMWNTPEGTAMDGPVDNAANMYSIGLKHKFDKNTFIYLTATEMVNQEGAHFDLGASGHGAKVDCKDQTGACFTGTRIKAVTVGMNFRF
jgi:predicted porin